MSATSGAITYVTAVADSSWAVYNTDCTGSGFAGFTVVESGYDFEHSPPPPYWWMDDAESRERCVVNQNNDSSQATASSETVEA